MSQPISKLPDNAPLSNEQREQLRKVNELVDRVNENTRIIRIFRRSRDAGAKSHAAGFRAPLKSVRNDGFISNPTQNSASERYESASIPTQ